MADNFEILMAVFGSILLLVPIATYYQLIQTTYVKLFKATLRIQVLATRTALFLPAYSIIMWLSLVVPQLYLPLQIPISIAEGYSFFSFFSMAVNNLGGADNTVAVLESVFESGQRPLIPFCCPTKASVFYERVKSALWKFLVVRTGTVTVQVIFQMIQHGATDVRTQKAAQAIQLIFTAFSFILLANGFGSLVMFYNLIYSHSKNLLGIWKILILKFSVGLIVIQGLIEEFLFLSGVFAIQESRTLSAQDRAQMVYCFVVLFEYTFLSLGVFYAYSSEIVPSERQERQSLAMSESYAATSRTNSVSVAVPPGGLAERTVDRAEDGRSDSKTEEAQRDGCERANVSMREYVDMIFRLGDLWDKLSCKSALLTEPLTSNDAEAYRPFEDK